MHEVSDAIEMAKSSIQTNSYANGTANDLVGERGMEMFVDPKEGKYHTVGENGPEMIDLPDDAIVFNAEQTSDLLGKGYTDTRGTVAHTDGTADGYDVADLYPDIDGDAFVTGNAYDRTVANGGLSVATAQNQKNGGGGGGQTTKENTKATQDNTDATNDNTEAEKKEGQVFDWVASRLSYLGDQTSKFADAITDFITYSDKMANLISGVDSAGRYLTGELDALMREISETRQGAARYWTQANKVENPYTDSEAASDKKKAKVNQKFSDIKSMINAGYKIDI